jgi:hypothetical protein
VCAIRGVLPCTYVELVAVCDWRMRTCVRGRGKLVIESEFCAANEGWGFTSWEARAQFEGELTYLASTARTPLF